MPRLCFHNLQKASKASQSANKLDNVIRTLRNFYYGTPTYYAFVEVSTTWGASDLLNFGTRIFEPHVGFGPCFRYDTCITTLQSEYSTEKPTEQCGLLAWKARCGAPVHFPGLLKVTDFLKPAGRGGDKGVLGVRKPAKFVDAATGITVYIYHPSPTHVENNFKHMVDVLKNRNRTLIVADFNVPPGGKIPFAGTQAEQYAQNNGLMLASPTQNTHRAGIIDYVMHTNDVTVSNVNILPKLGVGANSDHHPIYFDFK